MSGPDRHIDAGRLLEYAEGRLDATEAKQLDAHVQSCGVCRAELTLARGYVTTPIGEKMEGRSEILQGAFAQKVAARLESRIPQPARGAQRSVRAPRRGLVRPWLIRGLLAASVAVIGFGILQMRDGSQPSHDELGRQPRAGASQDLLELTIRGAVDGRYELQWVVPTGARDLQLRVLGSDGSLLLVHAVEGDGLLLDSSEFAPYAEDTRVFVQLVGTGPGGGSLRSVPRQLPKP